MLYPVRVQTSWSKTLSLARITYADTSPIILRKNLLRNAMFLFTSKWEEKDLSTRNFYLLSSLFFIDRAPFMSSIVKYFSIQAMHYNEKEVIPKKKR
jgi:hypothetical protein